MHLEFAMKLAVQCAVDEIWNQIDGWYGVRVRHRSNNSYCCWHILRWKQSVRYTGRSGWVNGSPTPRKGLMPYLLHTPSVRHRNMEKTKSEDARQCSAANPSHQVTAIAPTDAGFHQCGGVHFLLSVHDSTWPHNWLLLQSFSRILSCNIVRNTDYCLLSGIAWFSVVVESFDAATRWRLAFRWGWNSF